MPTERACGTRKPGMYAEIPLGENGLPIEWFVLDPPWPAEALGYAHDPSRELANKKQLYMGEDEVYHVIDWIGGDYPYVSDFIEEARTHGVSRKLPPHFPIEKLTAGQSTMLCIHPRAYNDLWDTQGLPYCKSLHEAMKHPGNSFWQEVEARTRGHETWDREVLEEERAMLHPVDGPCTWKAYQLVPEQAGTPLSEGSRVYHRTLGKTEFGTTYTFFPRGEDAGGLRAGFFMRLPLPILTFVDGNMQEKEREQMEKNKQKARDGGLTVKNIHMEYDPALGIDVEVEDDEEGQGES